MSKPRRRPVTRATPGNLDKALQSNDLNFVLEVYTDTCWNDRRVDNVVVKKLVHRITWLVGTILRHLLQTEDMKGMLDIVRQIERNEVVRTACINIPEFRKARGLVAAEYGDPQLRAPPTFHSWSIYQGEDRKYMEEMLEAEGLLSREGQVRSSSSSPSRSPQRLDSSPPATAPLHDIPLAVPEPQVAEPEVEGDLAEAEPYWRLRASGAEAPAAGAGADAERGDGHGANGDSDGGTGNMGPRLLEAEPYWRLRARARGDGDDAEGDSDGSTGSIGPRLLEEQLGVEATQLWVVLDASKAAMQDMSSRALRLEMQLAEERSRRSAEMDDFLVYQTPSFASGARANEKRELQAAGRKAAEEELLRRDLENKLQEAKSHAELTSTSLHEERRHADKRLRFLLQDLQGHLREVHASKDAAFQKLLWARSELAARDQSTTELRAELVSKSRSMNRLECRLDEALEAKESLRWQLLQMESRSDAKQKMGAETCDWLRQLHAHTEEVQGSRSVAHANRALRDEVAEVETSARLKEELFRSEVAQLRSELSTATATSGRQEGQPPR